MPVLRRTRDLKLLDALDNLERTSIEDVVWRVVREGSNPLAGSASGGRWDTGEFDVLYTSFEPDGALAEMYFHLSRQPVFPSKVRFTTNEISIKTHNTLKFANLQALVPLGVVVSEYAGILYEKIREIADAAHFLGFDGIISPNARWKCLNLALFPDRLTHEELVLTSASIVDWGKWNG